MRRRHIHIIINNNNGRCNIDLLHMSNYWWRWRWVAVASSLTTTIIPPQLMKFHLLNRCQLMTAAAVVVYIIVTNLPAAEELCMYIILRWDTAIKNCNCHCGGRRHILSSSSTTTIWLPRLICCYLELLMTVAAVIYTMIINLPVAEELCRYIILRWDTAICNKELQYYVFRFDYNIDYVAQVVL